VAEVDSGDLMTKRKAYIVPFIQPSPQAPEGFTELFNAYWDAVDAQISGLEAKIGVVKRIFAEGVLGKGDDALLMLEQTNRQAWRLAKSRVDAGARFDEYEDAELFSEVIDWGRCLSVGFVSQGVANAVSASYQDAAGRRQRQLDQRLEEGLQEGEAALILSGTTDMKLPDGVERFLVSPPELDALERWIRQVNEAARRAAEEAAARGQAPGQAPEEPPEPSGSSSQLWTPGS
jgi:hypothetical protein